MSEKLNEIDHGFLVQDDPVLADAGVTNVRFYRYRYFWYLHKREDIAMLCLLDQWNE